MTHGDVHWLTMVGTTVFVLAACAILMLSTLTFVAVWVGRDPGPGARPDLPPRDPDALL